MGSEVFIVGRCQQTSQRRAHAQDRKIGSRDEHSLTAPSVAGVGEVGTKQAMGGNPGERSLSFLQIPEHRITEDYVTVTRIIAGLRARFGTWCREIDQLLRILNRQSGQKHLIEEREDSRVRADSKG